MIGVNDLYLQVELLDAGLERRLLAARLLARSLEGALQGLQGHTRTAATATGLGTHGGDSGVSSRSCRSRIGHFV